MEMDWEGIKRRKEGNSDWLHVDHMIVHYSGLFLSFHFYVPLHSFIFVSFSYSLYFPLCYLSCCPSSFVCLLLSSNSPQFTFLLHSFYCPFSLFLSSSYMTPSLIYVAAVWAHRHSAAPNRLSYFLLTKIYFCKSASFGLIRTFCFSVLL